MTRTQGARQRDNRQGLERQLAAAADPRRAPRDRKRASRFAAALAEKLGILERPARCEYCRKRLPLERHHPDHARPLEVIYLCAGCHGHADDMALSRESA